MSAVVRSGHFPGENNFDIFYLANSLLFRPLDSLGEAVRPAHLLTYRLNHVFRLPSCFCPAIHKKIRRHIEAECVIETQAPSCYLNEWVFKCEQRLCGYYGKYKILFSTTSSLHLALLVPADRIWSDKSFYTRRYPFRGMSVRSFYYFYSLIRVPI